MERFSLSRSKTMISRALETKNILTEACSKHSFLVSKTQSAFHWMFTDSVLTIIEQNM